MNIIVYIFLLILVAVLFFMVGRSSSDLFNFKDTASRENHEQYGDLIQLAPDPIIILDHLGFLKSANLALEQASLYRANELVGKHFMRIGVIAESSLPKAVKEFELTLLGEKRSPFELEIIRKDKTPVDFEVNTRPIKQGGKITGVQVIFRDISERKRLEEQVRQSQKMEAVGQLAGGISHDFNNLLTAINGYSEMVLQTLTTDSPLYADVEEILKAGKMAQVLTGQLSAFSRRQVFEPTVINLNDLILHMDKLFRRLIREDIELIVLPGKDLGSVKTDSGSIQQVLTNLVVNARDAMPKGGKLLIETQNVELDPEYTHLYPEVQPGEYVLLAVSDTGVGISEEVQKRLFEPFFTTKEIGKGTGLGLATCYGIVRQSGGHINVYSEVGHGTTFKVYLPLVNAPGKPFLMPEKSTDLPCGSETVLVVEDEALVRNFTVRVLRDQGYKDLIASNGEEALHLVQKHQDQPIDLLITDMIMPQVGGRELASHLKKLWPEMHVIFTSGYTENISTYREFLDPNEGFLQKPFSPQALAVKVREVLDSG